MVLFTGNTKPIALAQALRHCESVLQQVPGSAPACVVSRARRLLARSWALLNSPADVVLEELIACRDEAGELEATPLWLSGRSASELIEATHYLRLVLTEAVKEARFRLAIEEEIGDEPEPPMAEPSEEPVLFYLARVDKGPARPN